MEESFRVTDAVRLMALIDRLAAQSLACAGDEFQLVGILRWGVPLGRLLSERLQRRTGRSFQVGELELKRYSDTLEVHAGVPAALRSGSFVRRQCAQ